MPSCRFEIFVSAYLDGELSAEERELFQRHLERCDTCRTLMAEWKEVESALRRQALRKGLGGEAVEPVRRELSRSGAFRRARRQSRLHRLAGHLATRWRRYALAAALAALLAVAAWGLRPPLGGSGHGQAPAPLGEAGAVAESPTFVEFLAALEDVLQDLVRDGKNPAGTPGAVAARVRDLELPTQLAYWRTQIAADGAVHERLARVETVLVLLAALPGAGADAEARQIAQAVDQAGLLAEVHNLKQRFLEQVY